MQLNLLIIVGVSLSLGLTDQGHDILWSLANDTDTMHIVFAIGGLALMTMAAFVTTRVLFVVWPWRGPPPPTRSRSRWVIGMTAAPYAGLGAAFLLAAIMSYQTVSSGRSGVHLCALIAIVCALVAAVWAAGMDVILTAKFDGQDDSRPNLFQRILLAATQLSTGHPRSDLNTAYFLSLASLVSIAAFVAATYTPHVFVFVGPVGTIVLAATVWVFLLNPIALALARIRIPFVLVLGLMLFVGGLNSDNHEIRERSSPAVRTPVPQAFNEWLRLNAAATGDPDRFTLENPYPVFVVAAAGGGIRNAYWTAGVLGRIEDGSSGFCRHLFVISGVSGGSVGGAVYTGLQRDYAAAARTNATPSFQAMSSEILDKDLLSPLLAKLMLPDALQRFMPIPIGQFDRARALEDALSDAYAMVSKFPFRMDLGFYGLDPLHVPGTPLLALNTTRVETGARAPVSHLELGSPATIPLRHDVSLKVAALMSARFPVVTPAARLPRSAGDGRVVDGGYFENSGAATLVDIIDQIMDHRGEYDIPFKIHVITTRYAEPVPVPNPGIAGELLSPLRTSLATRRARGALARTRLEAWVNRYAATSVPGSSVSGDIFMIDLEPDATRARVPLGWRLSTAARDEMDRQLNLLPHPAMIADILKISESN